MSTVNKRLRKNEILRDKKIRKAEKAQWKKEVKDEKIFEEKEKKKALKFNKKFDETESDIARLAITKHNRKEVTKSQERKQNKDIKLITRKSTKDFNKLLTKEYKYTPQMIQFINEKEEKKVLKGRIASAIYNLEVEIIKEVEKGNEIIEYKHSLDPETQVIKKALKISKILNNKFDKYEFIIKNNKETKNKDNFEIWKIKLIKENKFIWWLYCDEIKDKKDIKFILKDKNKLDKQGIFVIEEIFNNEKYNDRLKFVKYLKNKYSKIDDVQTEECEENDSQEDNCSHEDFENCGCL